MKPLWVALAVPVALWGANGRAQDKAQCFDAASQAQTLRDAHKLIEAREQLRICARQTCPGLVQKDCVSWLDAVEQGLPTVVFSAKDGAGRDLFDVSVTVDGQQVASKLEGDALPMNPGPRTFHFQTADGVSLDQQMLIREGVKNQSIAVVLATPGTDVAKPSPGLAPSDQGRATPSAETSTKGGFPLRTMGWIAGGVGVVGVGLGAAFGVVAMSDKSGAHCDASGACQPGPLSAARSAASISTVGFAIGGVFLAGGVALLLVAPSGKAVPPAAATPSTLTVKIAPMVGARDGGLLVAGSW